MTNFFVYEYKSIGHPDTLTDIIVSDCSKEIKKFYIQKYGRELHYNIDKALFSAGNIKIVPFDYYNILSIPTFILGGQVSELNPELISVLTDSVFKTIKRILPNLPVKVEIRCSNVSGQLTNISDQDKCNDTSFGVGYYPPPICEVTFRFILSKVKSVLKKYSTGKDYKVMYTPYSTTINVPLLFNKVKSKERYIEIINNIRAELSGIDNLFINTDMNSGSYYISVFGSSIECGDDGQVGRGNRVNGIISPHLPMTIEAHSGKNSKTHTGRIYQRLAFKKAKEISLQNNTPVKVILISKTGYGLKEYELVYENM